MAANAEAEQPNPSAVTGEESSERCAQVGEHVVARHLVEQREAALAAVGVLGKLEPRIGAVIEIRSDGEVAGRELRGPSVVVTPRDAPLSSGTKRLHHPMLGDFELDHVVLQIADDPEQKLVAFTAGAHDAQRIVSLIVTGGAADSRAAE